MQTQNIDNNDNSNNNFILNGKNYSRIISYLKNKMDLKTLDLSRFSTEAIFVTPHRGYLAMSEDMFSCHN